MKKIMFNDKYGLTKAVLEGRKTQTRRTTGFFNETISPHLTISLRTEKGMEEFISKMSRYKVGEVVAVAQAYKDIPNIANINYVDVDWARASKNKPFGKWGCASKLPGWKNKMFVRADQMPHHIRITNIRVERLQDISDEDCLAEGICKHWDGQFFVYYSDMDDEYTTPQAAFADLIDKVSGKGTWDSNPYVFVYDFELVK